MSRIVALVENSALQKSASDLVDFILDGAMNMSTNFVKLCDFSKLRLTGTKAKKKAGSADDYKYILDNVREADVVVFGITLYNGKLLDVSRSVLDNLMEQKAGFSLVGKRYILAAVSNYDDDAFRSVIGSVKSELEGAGMLSVGDIMFIDDNGARSVSSDADIKKKAIELGLSLRNTYRNYTSA